MTQLRPAIFLDRDGTLIEDRGYTRDPSQVSLLAGSARVLRELVGLGFELIVVSNQSGVGRGFITRSEAHAVDRRFQQLMKKAGVPIAQTYYCFHAPSDHCFCRKPEPGHLKTAASRFDIDLHSSIMIGDKASDIKAGKKSGCLTILYSPKGQRSQTPPDRVAKDWAQVGAAVMQLRKTESLQGFGRLLDEFPKQRLLVIGDVMLDQYVSGDTRRISPEAPVPIVEVRQRSAFPGGAGNTAANIASLGGKPILVGLIGDDAEGRQLKRELRRRAIATDGLFVEKDRPTTTKVRVVAQNQQVARFDWEARTEPSEQTQKELIAAAAAVLARANGVVISDYGKGIVTSKLAAGVIRLAKGKPVVVDPKGKDFSKYRGATIVTPNLSEAAQATGHDVLESAQIDKAAEELRRITGAAVLLTRGAGGMTLWSRQQSEHIPTRARNVFDVTGAGDTVVAVLAMSLTAGASLLDSARLANIAAGIAVGKFGTAPVTIEELIAATHGVNRAD